MGKRELFEVFGTNRSAFHMEMRGRGKDNKEKTITFYILTDSGHGPHIPCIPSIILAQWLVRGEINQKGAIPCMDLITLENYLDALEEYDIHWRLIGNAEGKSKKT